MNTAFPTHGFLFHSSNGYCSLHCMADGQQPFNSYKFPIDFRSQRRMECGGPSWNLLGLGPTYIKCTSLSMCPPALIIIPMIFKPCLVQILYTGAEQGIFSGRHHTMELPSEAHLAISWSGFCIKPPFCIIFLKREGFNYLI